MSASGEGGSYEPPEENTSRKWENACLVCFQEIIGWRTIEIHYYLSKTHTLSMNTWSIHTHTNEGHYGITVKDVHSEANLGNFESLWTFVVPVMKIGWGGDNGPIIEPRDHRGWNGWIGKVLTHRKISSLLVLLNNCLRQASLWFIRKSFILFNNWVIVLSTESWIPNGVDLP